MSLTKKVTASIDLIMPFDDAVKSGPKEYSEYLENYDRKKLTLDGEPTIFVLEPVTYDQKTLISREHDGRESKIMALRCALRDVRGYVFELADGTTEILPKPSTIAVDPWGVVIDESWLRKSDFDDPVIEMIASVVANISGLAPL